MLCCAMLCYAVTLLLLIPPKPPDAMWAGKEQETLFVVSEVEYLPRNFRARRGKKREKKEEDPERVLPDA